MTEPPGRLLPPRALHLGREQQTAAPDEDNEFAPLDVEHGDFLPCALSAPPTDPALGLPHAQPTAGRAGKSLGQT